jgi:hypothetical protein
VHGRKDGPTTVDDKQFVSGKQVERSSDSGLP